MAFIELYYDMSHPKPEHRGGFKLTEDDGYYIVNGISSSLYMRLKKREAYPTSFCRQVDEHTITAGYGDTGSSEYLYIRLSSNGNIAIDRDTIATLPLFYSLRHKLFLLSDDYFAVEHQQREPSLSARGIVELLIQGPGARAMIWEDLHTLGSLEELYLNPNKAGIAVARQPTRDWSVSKTAPRTNPREFATRFSQHLDNFIDTLKPYTKAYEISGGLDSATLPLYLSTRHNYLDGQAGAIVLPGSFGKSQSAKLDAIERVTGTTIHRLHLSTHDHDMFHSVTTPAGTRTRPHFYMQDPYTHARANLYDHFVQGGAKVLVTGVGGDDVLENTPAVPIEMTWGNEARQRRAREWYPSFVTPAAISRYVDNAPAAPPTAPPLPISLLRPP